MPFFLCNTRVSILIHVIPTYIHTKDIINVLTYIKSQAKAVIEAEGAPLREVY